MSTLAIVYRLKDEMATIQTIYMTGLAYALLLVYQFFSDPLLQVGNSMEPYLA